MQKFQIDTQCAENRYITAYVVREPWDIIELNNWLKWHINEALGIDSETNGLSPWDPNFQVRAIQIASETESWVIDVQALPWVDVALTIRNHKQWIAHFSEAEIRFLCQQPIIPFNLDSDEPHVMDIQVLLAWYDPRTVVPQGKDGIDPRIAHSKGLKPTTTRELSPVLEQAENELHAWFRAHAPVGHRTPTRMKTWGFATVPFETPEYLIYAALDPLMTIRLWNKMLPCVGTRWPAFEDDICTQWDIDRATLRGMPVDGPYARWLDNQLNDVIDVRMPTLAAHGIGRTAMGPAVGKAFMQMGATSPKVTGTGAASWDREVLKELANQDGHIGALAQDIILVRQAIKFRAAYIKPMLDALQRDGRVHCSMRAVGTVTSRMSASDPALQQLPKKDTRVRAAYGGQDGWVFVSCDFAQGEPRVMAALSGDPNYVQAILHGDINNAVAAEAFGDRFNPAEGKTAGMPSYLMRQGSKAGFLAKCYGGGIRRVSATLGVTEDHGRQVIERWERAYSTMFARAAQLNNGTQITLANGWVIPLWDRFTVGSAGELLVYPKPSRKALNYETQGTQRALLVHAWRKMVSLGWARYLAMFMHDEIVLLVPEHLAEQARTALAHCMTIPLANGITMECEATVDGRTWLPQPDRFAIDELKAVEI